MDRKTSISDLKNEWFERKITLVKHDPNSLTPAQRFSPLILAALVVALTAVGYFLVTISHGASTTFYVAPANSNVNQNTSFRVAVRINTPDQISTVRANLTYPANLVDYVSIDGMGSAFSFDAGSSGGSGNISITRTNTGGTSITGDQLIATITLRTKTTAGAAGVNFGSGSVAFRPSDNTNALSGTSGGTYTVVSAISPISGPTPTPSPVTTPVRQPSPIPNPLAAPVPVVLPPTASPGPQPQASPSALPSSSMTKQTVSGGSNSRKAKISTKVAALSLNSPLLWLLVGLGGVVGLTGVVALVKHLVGRRRAVDLPLMSSKLPGADEATN